MKWVQLYIDNQYTPYRINEKGDIKSLKTYRILYQDIDKYGYRITPISINGKYKNIYTHQLVAETFIPNPDNKKYIEHINGNKTDNRVENLKWVDEKTPLTEIENLRKFRYDSTTIHEICKLLEDGVLTQKAIAIKLNVNKTLVCQIKNKQRWVEISELYDIK